MLGIAIISGLFLGCLFFGTMLLCKYLQEKYEEYDTKIQKREKRSTYTRG
jgi:hypothetical protein